MLLPVSLLLVDVLFAAASNPVTSTGDPGFQHPELMNPSGGPTSECFLGRGGTLTLFDGTTLVKMVRTDCKYRMVDAMCGGFRVEVTPGSRVEPETGDFTPDTLLVRVTRLKDGAYRVIRTSNDLITTNKDRNAKLVWQDLEGDLPLAFTYNRRWKAAVTVEEKKAFRVIFENLDDNEDSRVTFTCYSTDSFPVSEEPTLCDPEFSAAGHPLVFAHKILDDSRVNQSVGCMGSALLYQSSKEKVEQRWRAISNCNDLFVRAPVAKCLAEKDKLVGDDLENCVRYFLLGDSAACGALKEALTNGTSCPPAATTDYFPFLQNPDCGRGATPVLTD